MVFAVFHVRVFFVSLCFSADILIKGKCGHKRACQWINCSLCVHLCSVVLLILLAVILCLFTLCLFIYFGADSVWFWVFPAEFFPRKKVLLCWVFQGDVGYPLKLIMLYLIVIDCNCFLTISCLG